MKCVIRRQNRGCWAIGFAATRDVVSHLRHHGARSARAADRHMRWPSEYRRPAAICAIILPRASMATRTGRRVFDGVFTHVAGIGRVFHNTPFAQPFRTRTWHEDHDFPEVAVSPFIRRYG